MDPHAMDDLNKSKATINEMGVLTPEERETLARLEAKRGPLFATERANTDVFAGARDIVSDTDEPEYRFESLEAELAEMEKAGSRLPAVLREFLAIRDKWFPLG